MSAEAAPPAEATTIASEPQSEPVSEPAGTTTASSQPGRLSGARMSTGKAPPIRSNHAQQKPRVAKSYDPLLDQWYFNEVNKRLNMNVGLFRNYQINPYTKKTLDYVTPKITERRKALPRMDDGCCCCPTCGRQHEEKEPETEETAKLRASYKLISDAIYKSIDGPKCKFCEPQTELMRLGWFPDPQPPPTNNACLYIQPAWMKTPCCYYYPNGPVDPRAESYDERFRAVHQTAEFIRTETQLRAFDAIMNPEGWRGKVKTVKVRPGSLSAKGAAAAPSGSSKKK